MLDFHPEPTPASSAENELQALLERARLGEAAAVPALRGALDEHPELWQRFGDLASHAERSWIELIAGSDRFLADALGRKVGALAAELAGPAPTPLEKLLAARITANWLQLHAADAALAQSGEVSLKQAEFASKRQARVHKSYLMAIASLATVRRLLPADTATRRPERPGERDPADGPRDERPLASVNATPTEVEDRFKDLACQGPLALFDRPAGGPDRNDGPGPSPGKRGRSAS